jgi:hypothetical protein
MLGSEHLKLFFLTIEKLGFEHLKLLHSRVEELWFVTFEIVAFNSLVYVCVLVLEVVGGVLVSDETDRVWSEALFALTCCSSNQ